MGVLRFDSYDFHPTAVLDAHPDGILVVDHVGVVRYANPAAAAAFGTTLEGILGRQFNLPLGEARVFEMRGPGDRLLRLRCVPTLWASQPARLVCLSQGGEVERSEPKPPEVAGIAETGSVEEGGPSLAEHLDQLHASLDALQRSAGILGDRLRASPVLLVQQAADTLADHAAALDAVMPSDQAAHLPDMLDDLARELHRENATAVQTAQELQKTLAHLRSGLEGLRRHTVRSGEPTGPRAARPRNVSRED